MNNGFSPSRRAWNRVMTVLVWASAVLVMVLVAGIIGMVLVRGIPHISWNFLSTTASVLKKTDGILPAILNTLYVILLTLLIVLPLGVGAAVYLTEYASNRRLIEVIEFTNETLAGIPSIIYGLVGMLVFSQALGFQTCLLSGSLTLVVMNLPTIIRTTQESLKTVPQGYREGAMGLGAGKWHIIRTIVLPCSIDGIVKLDDVSFTANSGEILGIAGISGCGQKELLEAIAGLQPTENGSICYVEDDGTREELLGKDPLSIAEMGVALSFVPEDRLGMGLVGNMDLSDNMMLRSFRKGRGILTDRKSPRKLAETVVEELDVNTPGVTTPVRRLSGGNVQKVLVGREIASAPTVLLTAYAVRGLDINASYTIYDLINRQKERGVAVIYVGEDLDVLLELADRILVLCGGKVSGIVPGRGATKRDVGMMMTQLGGNEAHA